MVKRARFRAPFLKESCAIKEGVGKPSGLVPTWVQKSEPPAGSDTSSNH